MESSKKFWSKKPIIVGICLFLSLMLTKYFSHTLGFEMTGLENSWQELVAYAFMFLGISVFLLGFLETVIKLLTRVHH